MQVRLDAKDRALLYELDINSRQSAAQLARKINISKQGATFKINALLKKGVITSMPTVINTPLIGNLSFRMYFKLIDISPEEEEEFKQYFINHPNVPWIVGCEGIWDYIIVVFPSDFEAFEQFNVELNNRYGQYIEKKDIALVTRAYHFRAGYILGEKRDIPALIYAGQPAKVAKLDERDKKIITLLAANARIPLTEIADLLHLQPKTVWYKIEKLKKTGVIEGFTITTDLAKIGFERYKVFIRTKNMSGKRERGFIQYMRLPPYALYYSKSIGTNDVELEFIVKDSEQLHSVITGVRNKFGNVIKSYETLKIYREFKLNYYPSGKL